MSDFLRDAARRYAESNADKHGIARTPIPGLSVIRLTGPRELHNVISRPTICLVLQGKMDVTGSHCRSEAGAGETLLFASDAPSINRVSRASLAEPFVAMLIELDVALITSVTADMDAVIASDRALARVQETDDEVLSAASRLFGLIRRPESVPLLMDSLLRELHYWLLAGKHGETIKNLSRLDSAARRVARTVSLIRTEFAKPLPVDQLAEMAGMSPSAFHQHFREVTSMTPLQFQKQLRLIEARRLMLSEGASASSAAFAVGYQSVSQFNRDYRRMFGLPPVRETSVARKNAGQQRASSTSDATHFRRGQALITAATAA